MLPFLPSTPLLGYALFCVVLPFLGLGFFMRKTNTPRLPRVLSFWQGWGLFAAGITCVGTLTSASMIPVATVLLGLGGCRFVWPSTWKNLKGFPWMLCCALPVLGAGLFAHPALWDDFAHRLGSVHYLATYAMFPGDGRPLSLSGFPAYPYGLSIVGAVLSWISGQYEETALAVFGGVHLLMFVFLVHGALMRLAGGSGGWIGQAVIVTVGLTLNVMVQPEIIFSGYDDAALGITVAAALVAAVALWEQIQHKKSAWEAAVALASIGMLMVLLKQAGAVLYAGILLGLLSLALVRQRWQYAQTWWMGAIALLPPVLIWGLWRGYVVTHFDKGETKARAISQWNWNLLPDILGGMGQQIIEKPHLFLPHILVCVLAVHLWRKRELFYGRAVYVWLAAVLVLFYTVFMMMAYVAAFTPYEAARAASFERYMMHIGWACWLVVALFLVPILTAWLQQKPWRIWGGSVLAIITIVFAGSMAAFVPQEPVMAGRIRQALDGLSLPHQAKMLVYAPQGDGYATVVARYRLGQPEVDVVGLSVFTRHKGQTLQNYLDTEGVTHVLLLQADTPWLSRFPYWHNVDVYQLH